MSLKLKQILLVELIFAAFGIGIPILARLIEPAAWADKILIKILTCAQLMLCPVTLLPLGDILQKDPRPLLSPWGTAVVANVIIYLLIGGVFYVGKYHLHYVNYILFSVIGVYWIFCVCASFVF